MQRSRAHRMGTTVAVLLFLRVLAANGCFAADSVAGQSKDQGGEPGATVAEAARSENANPPDGLDTQVATGARPDYMEDEAGLNMKMVWVLPGAFEMGATDGATDERPVHPVQLDGFWIGATEVTVGQYERFTSYTAFETQAESMGSCWGVTTSGTVARQSGLNWRNPGFDQSDSCPVTHISWNDAEAFCSWLSRRTNKEYRLPTEAQWEYACRAGTKTRYPWGDDSGGGVGWCNAADQSAKRRFPTWLAFDWDDRFVFTAPVGRFKANAFGLHDMIGNVWEWCADWYDPDYYARSPRANPANALAGDLRVLRGGSWFTTPNSCRSANRRTFNPGESFGGIGFRVARIPGR